MDKENSILEKSKVFGVKIIRLCSSLPRNSAGYAMGDQLVRSGTSIGVNAEEAQSALSRADFIKCMNISLKEARESRYWLTLLKESQIIEPKLIDECFLLAEELVRILMKIVKTSRVVTDGA